MTKKEQYNLVELMDILSEHFGKAGEEFISRIYGEGLTSRLLHYICLIHELSNPNFSDMAKQLKVSKPSVSAAVDKLSELGYVLKVQSDADRRSFHLHLTEKGEKLVEFHDAAHRENAEFIEQSLSSDEVRTLVDLLNKVVRRM